VSLLVDAGTIENKADWVEAIKVIISNLHSAHHGQLVFREKLEM
jgi:hypothetical protein